MPSVPYRLLQQMLKRFDIEDLGVTSAGLQNWSESAFASYIMSVERRIFTKKYGHLPGYRFLRLGLSPSQETLDCFSQIHRFGVQSQVLGNIAEMSAAADFSDLPLPSEVVDVVLLQHSVEFSESPKASLNEALRVLAPGGHLIICVFNPVGPTGLIKFPMQLVTNRPQYRFHNLRKGRLIDWLTLLNCEVLDVDHGAYHWPRRLAAGASDGLKSLAMREDISPWDNACEKIRLPVGNFYMIHAVKRVARGISSSSRVWKRSVSGRLRSSTAKPLGSKTESK